MRYFRTMKIPMRPNNPYQHNPVPAITRSLEEGLDYQPDWRNRVVQKYLLDIAAADSNHKAHTLATIVAAEPDEHVIELLLFHRDGPTLWGPSTDYALRCVRGNAKTRTASKVKAMVLAEFLTEEIASEFGTESHKIDTFEYLFFDVRRYSARRTWLEGICNPDPSEARTSEEITQLRFLQIALTRGKSGVREDILGQRPQNKGYTAYPTILASVAKKAVERASEFYLKQNIATPPGEMDLKMLGFIARHAEYFELPIFANQVEDQPQRHRELLDAQFEKMLSADWETMIFLSASILNTWHDAYRKSLRAKLATVVQEEEKTKTDFSPVREVAGEIAINWGEVLEELDKLGFASR